MGKLVILLIWYRWFKKKDNNDTIGKIGTIKYFV